MQVTIYHNPDCGTSRNALAKLRRLGHEPRIVEYLKTPLSRAEIVSLAAQMDVPARAVVRRREPLFQELGLNEKDMTDDALLDALAEHPILMNRPIVTVQGSGGVEARLCRPSDLVKSLVKKEETQP